MLFIALGENRFLGGQNAAALNEAFLVPGASIEA
jgi:hypothetical protein